VKRPGNGVDHPAPSSAKVRKRIEIYLYSPSGLLWSVAGQTVSFLLEFTLKIPGNEKVFRQIKDFLPSGISLRQVSLYWLLHKALNRIIFSEKHMK
jgi:hypothetical protein